MAAKKSKPPQVGECLCGCGQPAIGVDFAQGHDTKVRAGLIRLLYGDTADGGTSRFLEHHGYGIGRLNLHDEFKARFGWEL